MMNKCLCLIIYTIAFLSCTSKDGDWEPMEWEVDTSAYLKKDHIAVPESGGTYTLFCNNYATFWLSSVFEDGVQIETDSTVGSAAKGPRRPPAPRQSAAKGMWSSIEIRKNAMIVVISPNDGNLSRCLSVTPTAGDVFSSFIFNQKEKEN